MIRHISEAITTPFITFEGSNSLSLCRHDAGGAMRDAKSYKAGLGMALGYSPVKLRIKVEKMFFFPKLADLSM